MKFTFGIITIEGNEHYVQTVLDSISSEFVNNDDSYEVIVVGGSHSFKEDNYTVIPFNENIKPSWITRKKNIITENAKYDNIVYMHDYIKLERGWYDGFKKFGNDFDICMTPILNANDTRFRDWTLWPHDITPDGSPNLQSLLPYDVSDLSKFMYISGAYWIAKRKLMQKFPLDETLSWGESEDVKWSKQVREKYNFKLNKYSSSKLLKQKDRVFSEATPTLIAKLQKKIK